MGDGLGDTCRTEVGKVTKNFTAAPSNIGSISSGTMTVSDWVSTVCDMCMGLRDWCAPGSLSQKGAELGSTNMSVLDLRSVLLYDNGVSVTGVFTYFYDLQVPSCVIEASRGSHSLTLNVLQNHGCMELMGSQRGPLSPETEVCVLFTNQTNLTMLTTAKLKMQKV